MEPLDPGFLNGLERLRWAFVRRPEGHREGDRRARARGPSEEFREHRAYSRGDDLRYVDWNAAARLDALFVKEFTAHRSEIATIVLSAGAAMRGKQRATVRIVLGLAYAAARSFAAVEVIRIPGGFWRATGARPDWHSLAALLSRPASGRGPDWVSLLRGFPSRPRRAIAAVGGFWQDGLDEAIPHVALRHDLAMIRIVERIERDPPAWGPVTLRDVETGEEIVRVVEDREVTAYRALYAGFEERLRAEAVSCGAAWVVIDAEDDAPARLWSALREAGVLG
jgi:uncharacterized protein (DUF58 family)